MALHMLQSTSPSFAVVLRGYDKDEVDEYLESFVETQSQAAEALEKAERKARLLTTEVRQLAHRVADLETCLRTETPRSADALGEHLTLMLREAEAAANETVARARQEAETLLGDARQRSEGMLSQAERASSESEALAASAAHRADEIADRLREEAQFKAEAIVRDAEARVEAKVTQVEEWARAVRAQIGAEQVRAAEGRARDLAAHQSDIDSLVQARNRAAAGLADMVQVLCAAVERATGEAPADSVPEDGDPGCSEPEGPECSEEIA